MTLSEDVLDTRISVDLSMPTAPLVQIRQWLATVLAELADDLLQDLMLVCTELVTNAYDHARGPRRLRIHRLSDRQALRIEVEDGSPGRLLKVGTSTLGPFRGRGLVMVDALSLHHWGTLASSETKTVWAELPLS